MIRAETTIAEELDNKVNDLAQKAGVTKREFIRRAIESYCDQQLVLNEINTKIDSTAAALQENTRTLFEVANRNQEACVDATVRNYDAIERLTAKLAEIEKRLIGTGEKVIVASMKSPIARVASIITPFLALLHAPGDFGHLG